MPAWPGCSASARGRLRRVRVRVPRRSPCRNAPGCRTARKCAARRPNAQTRKEGACKLLFRAVPGKDSRRGRPGQVSPRRRAHGSSSLRERSSRKTDTGNGAAMAARAAGSPACAAGAQPSTEPCAQARGSGTEQGGAREHGQKGWRHDRPPGEVQGRPCLKTIGTESSPAKPAQRCTGEKILAGSAARPRPTPASMGE
jgi:hypothetical protein